MEGDVAKPVIDPLESIFLNTLHFVQIAERNHVFNKYIEMVQKAPELFPEVREVKILRNILFLKKKLIKLQVKKLQIVCKKHLQFLEGMDKS